MNLGHQGTEAEVSLDLHVDLNPMVVCDSGRDCGMLYRCFGTYVEDYPHWAHLLRFKRPMERHRPVLGSATSPPKATSPLLAY